MGLIGLRGGIACASRSVAAGSSAQVRFCSRIVPNLQAIWTKGYAFKNFEPSSVWVSIMDRMMGAPFLETSQPHTLGVKSCEVASIIESGSHQRPVRNHTSAVRTTRSTTSREASRTSRPQSGLLPPTAPNRLNVLTSDAAGVPGCGLLL